MRVLIFIVGFVAANTLVSDLAAADVTSCSNGNLTRSVEVIYSDPGQSTPCEVLYSKPTEGRSSTPWRAESEGGYCEAKAAALIERLVGWGWQCSAQDATNTTDTTDQTDTPEETEAESS